MSIIETIMATTYEESLELLAEQAEAELLETELSFENMLCALPEEEQNAFLDSITSSYC